MAQYHSLFEVAFGSILCVELLLDEEHVLLLEKLALQRLYVTHSGQRGQTLASLA